MSALPLILTDVSLWRDGNMLIDGVSMTFSTGTKSIVLGHNGAGKSLLLRLCHGLMGPDSGSVAWAEKSPEGHRQQAMVFQKPIMLRRSVRANVTYGLKVNGVPKLRRQEIADEWELYSRELVETLDPAIFAILDDPAYGLARELPDASYEPGPTCIADYDDSNVVDGADLSMLLGFWGLDAPWLDLDGNDIIDVSDLAMLLGHWGQCAGG